eukprot:SAG11_NODE_1177_length_5600_cov_2.043447_3_plen_91_part_00
MVSTARFLAAWYDTATFLSAPQVILLPLHLPLPLALSLALLPLRVDLLLHLLLLLCSNSTRLLTKGRKERRVLVLPVWEFRLPGTQRQVG